MLTHNCLGPVWQIPKCLSICLKSLLTLNIRSSALPRLEPCSWNQISDLWPLFWPSLPSKAKIDQSIFKGPSLMNPFILVYWVWILTFQSIYVAKTKCWPLWPSSAIKAKWKLPIFNGSFLMNSFILTDTGTQNRCLLHKPYWNRGILTGDRMS